MKAEGLINEQWRGNLLQSTLPSQLWGAEHRVLLVESKDSRRKARHTFCVCGGMCHSLESVVINVQALLKSSEMYEEATKHAASHGIIIEGARIDLPKMMEQKDKAVDGLTKGIEFLFKKNKASTQLSSTLQLCLVQARSGTSHLLVQAECPVLSLQHCILWAERDTGGCNLTRDNGR